MGCKVCFGVYTRWAWSNQSGGRQEGTQPFNQTALRFLVDIAALCTTCSTLLHTERGKYCEKSFLRQDLVLRIEAKSPGGSREHISIVFPDVPTKKVVESWKSMAGCSDGCS